MSKNIITLGIGPGGSIKYFLTFGLDIGEPAEIPELVMDLSSVITVLFDRRSVITTLVDDKSIITTLVDLKSIIE